MLQIMTFDSWSSGITRPVILHDETGDALGGIFFITYVFVSAIIMANVVLAILIDKFLSTAKEIQDEEKREREEKASAGSGGDDLHPIVAFSAELRKEMEKMDEVINGP